MRIIRLKEVMDLTGLSRSTIYKYIAEGSVSNSGGIRGSMCRLGRKRSSRLDSR